MKKLFVCLVILVCLVVTYNVRTRAGSPLAGLAGVSPWLGEAGHLQPAAAKFLAPGAYTLWYLDLDVGKPWEICLAALMSWYCWLFLARSVWFLIGRRLGIAPLSGYRWWTRLWLPWRPVFRLWMRFLIWRKQLRYGSQATGSWTSFPAAMTKLYRRGADQTPLGRLWGWGLGFLQPVAAEGRTHIAVAAKSGAGKTTWGAWVIGEIPGEGAVLAIDTDGELASVLGGSLRRKGHPLFVLDAYGMSVHPSCGWNPLDEILRAAKMHGKGSIVRFTKVLADALVPEMNQMQRIFAASGRQGLAGIIGLVLLVEPPERRNLITVREYAARGLREAVVDPAKQTPHDALYLAMMRLHETFDDECGGQITAMIAGAAQTLKNGKNREGGNAFLSTVVTATSWIEIPELAATLTRSDFQIADLKLGNACVFLVTPVIDVRGVLNGYVRALSMMTFYIFENIVERPKVPCLFFMDEMPALAIEYLDTLAPIARRQNIRLVVIFQDIPMLKAAYTETWTSFISNAAVFIGMATDDMETLKYFCELCGKRTRRVRVDGPHWIWRFFGLSKERPRYQLVEEDLIKLDQMREFLARDRRQLIAFPAGEPPIRLALEGHTTALALWQHAPSRHYREPRLRALMRRILSTFWLRVSPDDGAAARKERA